MWSHTQEALLAQFRAYLEAVSANDNGADPPVEVDLYTLFGELAALKNEVRIESRQVKGALDQFRGLVEPLQTGNAALQGEIAHLRDSGRHAVRDALRPVLLELLDVRDRLSAGLTMNKETPLPKRFFKRLCRKEQAMLVSWREGQEMTLRRLDQLLAGHDVVPMDVLERPLDPRLARAVRVETHPGIAHGVVLTELRRGYFWQGSVLRPAEVVINVNKNEMHGREES
ncbi:MAG: nucleotide exchange factor GrpE [Magnetococcales bacterium]|nr:nucleotide exchange factor GrpE [Magnetococcales bacterium]